MRTEDYLRGVQAIYQGEVLGEALFSGLLAAAVEPCRQQQFAAMLQLETEAKARLRPFLTRLGLSVVEDATARREGERLAVQLAALPWPEFLDEFARSIAEYEQLYADWAKLAPPEDAQLMRGMVEHERVFLRYAQAERAGRSAQALALIEAELVQPLGAVAAVGAARAAAGR